MITQTPRKTDRRTEHADLRDDLTALKGEMTRLAESLARAAYLLRVAFHTDRMDLVIEVADQLDGTAASLRRRAIA